MRPYKSLLQKKILMSLVILIVSCLGLLYAEEEEAPHRPRFVDPRLIPGTNMVRGQIIVGFYSHVTQEDVDAFIERFSQYELRQLGCLMPTPNVNVAGFAFNDSLVPDQQYMLDLVRKEKVVYFAISNRLGTNDIVHSSYHFFHNQTFEIENVSNCEKTKNQQKKNLQK